MGEWVGKIEFQPEIERKLRNKHQLTPDQVRSAVALGAHDHAEWHDDPSYGLRLMLTGEDADGPILAYLRPLDRSDGVWECLTAWRL